MYSYRLYILHEIDYFDYVSLKLNNKIYYYNDKFYLTINRYISKKKYFELLEYSKIIYDKNIFEVINKGIKLNCVSHNLS